MAHIQEPIPEDEETQETHTGHTIPVPTRGDVFGDLAKVAQPRKPLPADGEGTTEK
jgi:hypothetical protein